MWILGIEVMRLLFARLGRYGLRVLVVWGDVYVCISL